MCLEATKANIYADDTNLSCAGLNPSEIETTLKKYIENAHQWLRCNKVTLNKDKTEFTIIASRYRLKNSVKNSEDITDISLALGNNNIERVNNKKSPGFIIHDPLKRGDTY